jgi:hypothetical protein
MARKPLPETDAAETRDRPVRTMIALVVGFFVIVGIATWTVILPELRDDAGEEEESGDTQGGAPAGEAPATAASPPAS